MGSKLRTTTDVFSLQDGLRRRDRGSSSSSSVRHCFVCLTHLDIVQLSNMSHSSKSHETQHFEHVSLYLCLSVLDLHTNIVREYHWNNSEFSISNSTDITFQTVWFEPVKGESLKLPKSFLSLSEYGIFLCFALVLQQLFVILDSGKMWWQFFTLLVDILEKKKLVNQINERLYKIWLNQMLMFAFL